MVNMLIANSLSNYPAIAALGMSLIQIVIVIYIIIAGPYEGRITNYRQILIELNMAVVFGEVAILS